MTLLDNGSIKMELPNDMYCIIPKGYRPPNYEGFFDTTRKANYDIANWTVPENIEQIISDFDTDLTLVRKHALDVDNLNCYGDLLLYDALTNAHIFRLKLPFEDFTENLQMVTTRIYGNVLCIEGLDADVESGTAGKFHITPDELFPVFMSAMAFNTTVFKNVQPSSTVTCYFLSGNLIRHLGMYVREIGRFHFGRGMLNLAENKKF